MKHIRLKTITYSIIISSIFFAIIYVPKKLDSKRECNYQPCNKKQKPTDDYIFMNAVNRFIAAL